MIEGPELSLSGPQDFINRFVPSLPPASYLDSGTTGAVRTGPRPAPRSFQFMIALKPKM